MYTRRNLHAQCHITYTCLYMLHVRPEINRYMYIHVGVGVHIRIHNEQNYCVIICARVALGTHTLLISLAAGHFLMTM